MAVRLTEGQKKYKQRNETKCDATLILSDRTGHQTSLSTSIVTINVHARPHRCVIVTAMQSRWVVRP